MNVNEVLVNLQTYLRANDPESLLSMCGVAAKQIDGFWILDYDMISVRWEHESQFPYICRGLVLDSDFNLVAFGLAKFFNDFEGRADPIDWGTAVVFEKCDGTMINRWWNIKENKWSYSTRYNLGSSLAATKVNGMNDMTWDSLIQSAFQQVESQIKQSKGETWVFEMESPFNRVVVLQDRVKVTLLAIRDNATLLERDIYGHPLACRTYKLTNFQEIENYVNSRPGLEFEGLVTRSGKDGVYVRCKSKNAEYMTLHHLKDSVMATWKNVAALVRTGDYAEKLKQIGMDEMLKAADKMHAAYWAEVDSTAVLYEKLSVIEDRKAFAIAVQASGVRHQNALFSVKGGKSKSVHQYFLDQDASAYLRFAELIGLRDMIPSGAEVLKIATEPTPYTDE